MARVLTATTDHVAQGEKLFGARGSKFALVGKAVGHGGVGLFGVDIAFTEMKKDLVSNAFSEILLDVGGLCGRFVGVILRILEEVLVHSQHLVILAVESEHPVGPVGFRVDKDDTRTVGVVIGFGFDQHDVSIPNFPARFMGYPEVGAAKFRIGSHIGRREYLALAQVLPVILIDLAAETVAVLAPRIRAPNSAS